LAGLASHRCVGEVRGLGLMAAVELVADKATKAEFPPEANLGPKVHAATQARGMCTRLRGDVYNLAPCYVTSESQLEQMVQILGDSIDEVLGG
jgi:4-aminobutyrate--pyruvate transaminase